MKLDLNFKFKDLDGNEGGENAAKLAAQILCVKPEGMAAVKAYELALKLHKDGEAEIDSEDLKAFRNVVEKTEGLTALAKAQILLASDLK
jgi:hypothetical protein